MDSKRKKAIELFKHNSLLRSSDLTSLGIDRKTIKRMVESGELIKIARGLYSSKNYIPGTYYSLIEAQKLIPQGVICLHSALSYYEIGTQNPSSVWMAIDNRAWKPNVENLSINLLRFSGDAYNQGITEQIVEGESIRIYSISKTLADCFKFRNKIGLSIAIEALKIVLEEKLASIDELLFFASICRVKAVMTPYLESLV